MAKGWTRQPVRAQRASVHAHQRASLSADSMREKRRPYDRRAAIPKVLAVWPHELADDTWAGRVTILAKLRRALRHERSRGIAGHWCYDLARHAELLRVYREELAAVARKGYAPD
jgi:hypothetical protein